MARKKDSNRFNTIRKVNRSVKKTEVVLYKRGTGTRKITIEKGVPIPRVSHGVYSTRWGKVIDAMEPGDSVVVKDKKEACVMRTASRTRGRTVTQQKLDDGMYRVWATD